MKVLRDPPRLRELDAVFGRTVERAHAHLPSTARIEAVVRAVEQAGNAAAASSGAAAATPSILAGLKPVAITLSVLGAVSSGLWWAGRTPPHATVETARPASRPSTSEAPAARRSRGAPNAPAGTDATSPREDAASAHTAPRDAPAGVGAASPLDDAASAHTAPPPVPGESRIEAPESAHKVEKPPAARRTARQRPTASERSLRAGRTVDDVTPQRASAPRATPAWRGEPLSQRSESTTPDDDVSLVPSELTLLEQAQRALRSSPERALALTERHRFEYPRGQFAQEREQIAIEALFGIGRYQTMRERARTFRRAYPNSAHTARILELLEAAR